MGLAEESENNSHIFWHQVDQKQYIYECHLYADQNTNQK